MKELIKFDYQGKEVRTITDEQGNPWWVAKDVCDILGLADVSDAVTRLDEDEKGKTPIIDSIGRKQEMLTVNESGIYILIMRSNKAEAKHFRKWVTSEILPSIRKTGSYSIKAETPEEQRLIQLQMMLDMTKEQIELKNRVGKIEAHLSTKASLEKVLPETKPKTLRASLNEVLRSYAQNNNIDFQYPWTELYRQFYYRNNYNITLRAKNSRMKILEYAEQEGILEDLMALAVEMFC
jgi:prophage antirepressor-like protein